MGIGTRRLAIGRETLLAALVLALVFLNFGHVAPSLGNTLAYGDGSSFCGDPLTPGDPHHAPCHACRIGAGADLPPQPGCIEPVSFAELAAGGPVPAFLPVLSLPTSVAQPRGPPELI
jgi:hypothetical protein